MSSVKRGRKRVADILFHPEAQAEYDAAIAWYQSRSAQAATRLESEMERVLGLIGASPAMFANYDADHHYASLKRFPYSVVYRVDGENVYVIAAAHASRSPGYWQGRT